MSQPMTHRLYDEYDLYLILSIKFLHKFLQYKRNNIVTKQVEIKLLNFYFIKF